MGLGQSDHINRMITLTVITLNGFYSIYHCAFDFLNLNNFIQNSNRIFSKIFSFKITILPWIIDHLKDTLLHKRKINYFRSYKSFTFFYHLNQKVSWSDFVSYDLKYMRNFLVWRSQNYNLYICFDDM